MFLGFFVCFVLFASPYMSVFTPTSFKVSAAPVRSVIYYQLLSVEREIHGCSIILPHLVSRDCVPSVYVFDTFVRVDGCGCIS